MEKTRKYYQELVSVKKDYMVMLKNFLSAFIFGGGLAILGQLIFDLYYKVFHIQQTDSALYMTLTMVMLAGILTALGIYDKLGQIGKCGLAIPITGEGHWRVTQSKQIYKYICMKEKKYLKLNKNWEKYTQNGEKSRKKEMIPYDMVL